MNLKIQLMPVWLTCLLCVLPIFSSADEQRQNTQGSVCTYHVDEKVITPYSVVTFMDATKGGGEARWICVDDKLILEASHGEGRENDFDTAYYAEDFLREDGKMVMRQGRPITLRMVVNENAGRNDNTYNTFWLLDFRNKEPLLVGPMRTPGLGRVFSVIWHEDNVIVIFDDDGGPGLGARRYHEPNWGKEERHFVKDVEAEAEDAIYAMGHEVIKMVNRPLMNKDGILHPGKRNYINMPHDRLVKNGKLILSTLRKNEIKLKNARNVYPGYHYDYKTKKLTAIAIEED